MRAGLGLRSKPPVQGGSAQCSGRVAARTVRMTAAWHTRSAPALPAPAPHVPQAETGTEAGPNRSTIRAANRELEMPGTAARLAVASATSLLRGGTIDLADGGRAVSSPSDNEAAVRVAYSRKSREMRPPALLGATGSSRDPRSVGGCYDRASIPSRVSADARRHRHSVDGAFSRRQNPAVYRHFLPPDRRPKDFVLYGPHPGVIFSPLTHSGPKGESARHGELHDQG